MTPSQIAWVAGLGLWLAASLVAGFVAPTQPLVAVAVAAVGGVVFGLVGARRVDSQRVRVRVGKRRRRRTPRSVEDEAP